MFKTMGDVHENVLQPLFLVAVETAFQDFIRGNLLRQYIEIIQVAVLTIRF
jgi:hypothetical protein